MPDNICWVDRLITIDRRITTEEISSTISLGKHISMEFIEKPDYSTVGGSGVQWLLTGAYRETSKAVDTDLLHQYNAEDEGLFCCQLSREKKLRSTTLNSNSRGNRWNGTACFSQRSRNSILCRQHEKSWLRAIWIRNVLFLWPTCQSNNNEMWLLHFSTKKSKCSPSWSTSHDVSEKSCFSMAPDHTPQRMPLRPSQNFHGECSHIHTTVLTPHHHIFTCLVIKRQSARISWQCTTECTFQWL